MATENKALATETAAALLTRIKAASDEFSDPGSLRTLAEAYALVAENDPKKPGRAFVG